MEKVNWNLIKEWIVNNTQDDYSSEQRTTEDLVDLMVDIIMAPVEEKDLKGIPELYATALQRILIDQQDKGSQFGNISNIEQLLRKVLFIVDVDEYKKQNDEHSGLNKLIKSLKLDTEHNFYNPDTGDTLGKHLHDAYELRNKESHYCQKLNEVKLISLLQSVLVVYLFAIDKNYLIIKQWLAKQDNGLQTYLDTVKKDFHTWNSRFVPINGREQIQEVAIYAIETDWEKKENRQMREGEVEYLRNILIGENQNQMIIVGEAGIGKTTTMKYLAYRDAIAGRLPVYIELKLITAPEQLEKKNRDKIKGISDKEESLLSSTNTCIFIDGLNEVMPSVRNAVYRELISLIKRFPDVFFLISTRPQEYDGQLGHIPVFSLQKMDIFKIQEFMQKNTNQSEVRSIITEAIHSNPEWLRILGTPLILFMLIQVVTLDGSLPDDENKIIIRFIRGLYDREKGKDFGFDKEYFHAIVCRIAFECIDKIGNTNSGFSFMTVRSFLSKEIDIRDHDLRAVLQKSVELNLMVQDGNLYSFSHQSYQDALAGEYFNTFLAR